MSACVRIFWKSLGLGLGSNTKMANKKKNFYVQLYFVFLLSACYLKTFGEENGSKERPESETISIAQKELVDDISPGEVIISNMDDGKTTEGSKTLDGEEKVKINQSEDGKTKEEVKAHEDIKQPEGEEGVNEGEKKEGEKKEGEEAASEEEKQKEKEKEEEKEPGIDLKILKDSDFEHLTQASSGATTGDWLVLL